MTEDLRARFRVVRLESESLKRKTKADDHAKWGAPMLDMEQYQMKAQLQRETPFAQSGTIHWALVERTVLDTEEDDDALTVEEGAPLPTIYSKCECHREECMMRKADGTIVQGYSYHIGSVFTNPEHRKQGLASFFLKQVAAKLEAMPNALGSVLYSDVGPTFYDRLGWRLHESRVAVLSTSAAKNNAADTASPAQEGERLYLDDRLDTFLAKDKLVIQDEISSAAYEGREVFSPIATRDSIEWLFVVGAHYANVQGFKELPKQCGLKFADNAFIIWYHKQKESALYVVRARFPEDAPALIELMLDAALREARKYGLESVKIWSPPSCLAQEPLTSRFEIEFQDRSLALSSAMVFGQSQEPALPVWYPNEKYSWV